MLYQVQFVFRDGRDIDPIPVTEMQYNVLCQMYPTMSKARLKPGFEIARLLWKDNILN